MTYLTFVVQLVWVCQILYNSALAFTKLSALFQFLRFATLRSSRVVAWIFMSIITLYGIAIVIACVLQCQPSAFYWDKEIASGKCMNRLHFGISTVTINVVTDLAVISLPVHVLRDLKLSRRDRIALQCAFAIGGLYVPTTL